MLDTTSLHEWCIMAVIVVAKWFVRKTFSRFIYIAVDNRVEGNCWKGSHKRLHIRRNNLLCTEPPHCSFLTLALSVAWNVLMTRIVRGKELLANATHWKLVCPSWSYNDLNLNMRIHVSCTRQLWSSFDPWKSPKVPFRGYDQCRRVVRRIVKMYKRV